MFIGKSLRGQRHELRCENRTIQRMSPRYNPAKDKRALRNEDSQVFTDVRFKTEMVMEVEMAEVFDSSSH